MLGVAMEWQLGDENVRSPVLEYRLKSAITFEPTVGLRSNFYRVFPEAVFIGVAMECLLGDEDVSSVILEYLLKSTVTFDPTVELRTKFYKGF